MAEEIKNWTGRFRKGYERLLAEDPDHMFIFYEQYRQSPEISRILNSYASGDMYTRSAIDKKLRQMLIIAVCVARGVNDNSLRAHMDTAIDYGATPDELRELLLYTAFGAGFPICFWGLRCLNEVVRARREAGRPVPADGDTIRITPDEERFAVAETLLNGMDDAGAAALKASVGGTFPTFYEHMASFGYGDVFSRDILDERTRHLFMIATLTSLDKASDLVELHLRACTDAGMQPGDFEELLLVFSVYIGFASALDFAKTVQKIYAEQA